MKDHSSQQVGQHGTEAPSAWVQRWSHLVKPGGTVLDVACGHGRHTQWFYDRNHAVVAVDRAPDAISFIANNIMALPGHSIEAVVADIENGPWPFESRQFDGVVVTHYLWRPLMPALLNSLAPGGVLIYETFADGNETVGKPSRPDFLLRNGELLTVFSGLRVVSYEDGFQDNEDGTMPRFMQRIAAVRKSSDVALACAETSSISGPPARYRLP